VRPRSARRLRSSACLSARCPYGPPVRKCHSGTSNATGVRNICRSGRTTRSLSSQPMRPTPRSVRDLSWQRVPSRKDVDHDRSQTSFTTRLQRSEPPSRQAAKPPNRSRPLSPATRKAASSRGSSRRGGNRPLIAYEPAVEPVSRASAGSRQLRYISETTEASAPSLRPAVGERRLRKAGAAISPPPATRSAVTTASRDETRRAVAARAGAGSTRSTSTRSPTTPTLRWRIVGGLRRRREARRDRSVAEA